MNESKCEREAIIPAELSDYYEDDWRMSPGIFCNGFLFLTGMTGTPPKGTISNDFETQIVQSFENINLVLKQASMDFTNVVEMTSYHVGIERHLDIFKSVRNRYVAPPYPAWTAVEVTRLITPEAFVEIRAIAVATPSGNVK